MRAIEESEEIQSPFWSHRLSSIPLKDYRAFRKESAQRTQKFTGEEQGLSTEVGPVTRSRNRKTQKRKEQRRRAKARVMESWSADLENLKSKVRRGELTHLEQGDDDGYVLTASLDFVLWNCLCGQEPLLNGEDQSKDSRYCNLRGGVVTHFHSHKHCCTILVETATA